MTKAIRGFKMLLGETIKNINARACNVVIIECVSGRVVELDCDDNVLGSIGIIRCTDMSKERAKS